MGLAVVLVVLSEVVQRGRFACRVVAAGREHRYVDMAELFSVGDEFLPEPIVTGMVEPALKDPIVPAVHPVEIPIRFAARVPARIKGAPCAIIAAAPRGRFLRVGKAERPSIGGVA